MSRTFVIDESHIIELAKYLHLRQNLRMHFCVSLHHAIIQVYEDDYTQLADYQLVELIRLYKHMYGIDRKSWEAAAKAVDIRPEEQRKLKPI